MVHLLGKRRVKLCGLRLEGPKNIQKIGFENFIFMSKGKKSENLFESSRPRLSQKKV